MTRTGLRISLLLAVFYPALLNAQYHIPQNRTWAMGFNTGLDFNTEPPTVITTNLASGNEGCASVCDSAGALLFYTNGTNVWTADGTLMPNGTDINEPINNTISTTQGALIVPDPANSDRYYLFSLTSVLECRLYCNVIDMSLNSGQGDIDMSFPLRGTVLAGGLTEKMVAVPGCNNKVWVLVHTEATTEFKAFAVDELGVDSTPVTSLAGNFPANYYTQGVLKVAPDANRLMTCNFKSFSPAMGVEVYDFDHTTGLVSNAQILDSIAAYGGTFSPDGSKVYVQAVTFPGTVYQYDLSAAEPSASKINLGPSGQYTDMKLAPDGKIYFGAAAGSPGFNNYRYMGRINAPDAAGVACSFQDSVTNLLMLNAAQTAGALAQGLPNEVVYAFPGGADQFTLVMDTVICRLGEENPITLSVPAGYDNYVWDDNTTDTQRTITESGDYWLSYSSACGNYTDTFKVMGENIPLLSLNFDDNNITATGGFASYTWYKGDTLLSDEISPVLSVTANGWYSVVAISSKGACTDSASIEVTGYTGISDKNTLENVLTIFPNPARNEVNVRAPIDVNLILLQLDGRVAMTAPSARSLSVKNLNEGIYLLRIEDKKGKLIKVEKIVKIQ